MSIKRLDTERPYVSSIEIDSTTHHLICFRSDGSYIDNGYFPNDGIKLHYGSKENPKLKTIETYCLEPITIG